MNKARLDEMFRSPQATRFGPRPHLFLWTECRGTDGGLWGSYKLVFQDELNTRDYTVFCADGKPAIHYVDALYNSRTFKQEPIPIGSTA